MGLFGLKDWMTWPFGQDPKPGPYEVNYPLDSFQMPGGIKAGRKLSGPQMSFANMAQIITNVLPYLTASQNAQILPTAQANFDAESKITPQQLQMMTEMYNKYMPALTDASSGIQQRLQSNTAATNAAVAGGSGSDALNAAIKAFNIANPNFATTSNAGAKGISDLMGSIDLTGALSGSEQAEIDRSLARNNAQTGTINTPSATNAVSNAMRFGEAGYKRQEQAKSDLSAAIAQATSFLPTTRTGIDSWGISTGTNPAPVNSAPALFGTATGTGTGTAANATGGSSSMLQALFGNGTSMSNADTAANASKYSSNNQLTGSIIGSILGMI